MMNEHGKSDRPVVPAKSPNKAGQPAAEGTEGSGLTKGNLQQQNASRTPSRTDAPSALERVRQAASKDKEVRFTALLHHIYNLETLRMAYFCKKEAAPGVYGETWRHYGETLEDNLQDLSHRLKRGAYGAKPASCAGCALHRTADEESELGARCGHSQLFRWSFPRMAGEVR